ncbi:MAG: Ig-like domain-containing protein, partial [Oscillospiraceae bacterium]|nr:Ig-like domain-containing protein [Oscillospiraceae bacterium]
MKKALWMFIIFVLIVGGNVAGGMYFFPEYAVTGIEVTGGSESMTVGGSQQLTPVVGYVLPLPTRGVDVIFSSSSPEVIEADESGMLTALDEGEATITVMTADEKHKFLLGVKAIYANQLVAEIDTYTLGVGEEMPVMFTAGDYSDPELIFTSGDTEIVYVNENGVLSARKIGEATVTAESLGYRPVSCGVSVKAAPKKITPVGQDYRMGLGEVCKIQFVCGKDEACQTYTYESSDEKVVRILEDGSAEAVGKGSAEVTATSYNGKSAKVEIKVGAAPSEVLIKEKSKTGYVAGKPVAFTTEIKGGESQSLTWRSENPSIAEVDESGQILCKGKGTTTISCTTYNGKQATATLKVRGVEYEAPYLADRVNKCVAAMAEAYPEMVEAEPIGETVCGREIMMMKVGKGSRKVFVGAAMHSTENVTTNFTLRCIEEYIESYYGSGKYGKYNIKKMLDTFTLYVVPSINPDGLDIVNGEDMPLWTGGEEPDPPKTGRPWREEHRGNTNGVNLNANFPFRWHDVPGRKTEPSLDGSAGSDEMSEPEAAALVELCRANEFEWMFSMHCVFNKIYWRDEVNG